MLRTNEAVRTYAIVFLLRVFPLRCCLHNYAASSFAASNHFRRCLHLIALRVVHLVASNDVGALYIAAPTAASNDHGAFIFVAVRVVYLAASNDVSAFLPPPPPPPSTAASISLAHALHFAAAYKNVIGARRASWRIISLIEQKEESRDNEDHVTVIRDYRSKIEFELSNICDGILKLLNSRLIPSASSDDSKVCYLKMMGDYHRFQHQVQIIHSHLVYSLTLPRIYSTILEFKIGDSSAYRRNGTPLYAFLRSDLVNSGFHEVESRGRGNGGGLTVKTNPTAGGRVDGGSVGLVALGDGGSHDVVAARGTRGGEGGEKRVAEGSVGEGIEVSLALGGSGRGKRWGDRGAVGYPERGKAFDEAITELDTLGEESYKDSTLIMQLLRDNLTLWTSNMQDDGADEIKEGLYCLGSSYNRGSRVGHTASVHGKLRLYCMVI
ncbi:hypothetical protein LR48_Vigan10g163900 [Vigna angularis]|uniref:14-3-3 domain-containing protein n=1 Tax=Phaseolus angularis TaxID=3914 RepID=A0A0L9VLH1_PHAAN|nr:hypothetical protein LR48_Vigan10g163900 [Vigna angularis]